MSIFSRSTSQLPSIDDLKQIQGELTDISEISDNNKDRVIEVIRRVSELVVYADCHSMPMLEYFYEKNMVRRIVSLINPAGPPEVITQILQTISILISNIQNENAMCTFHLVTFFTSHSVFMLSNNNINRIIELLDFNTLKFDEAILSNFVSLMKSVSVRLNLQTLQFFFDSRQATFPLLHRSIDFLTFEDNMMRVCAQAIILHILKIKDDALFGYLLRDNVKCRLFHQILIRISEIYSSIQKSISSSSLKYYLQDFEDILYFLQDIFSLNLLQFSDVLALHVVRNFIYPIILDDVLQRSVQSSSEVDSSEASGRKRKECHFLSCFVLSSVYRIIRYPPFILLMSSSLLSADDSDVHYRSLFLSTLTTATSELDIIFSCLVFHYLSKNCVIRALLARHVDLYHLVDCISHQHPNQSKLMGVTHTPLDGDCEDDVLPSERKTFRLPKMFECHQENKQPDLGSSPINIFDMMDLKMEYATPKKDFVCEGSNFPSSNANTSECNIDLWRSLVSEEVLKEDDCINNILSNLSSTASRAVCHGDSVVSLLFALLSMKTQLLSLGTIRLILSIVINIASGLQIGCDSPARDSLINLNISNLLNPVLERVGFQLLQFMDPFPDVSLNVMEEEAREIVFRDYCDCNDFSSAFNSCIILGNHALSAYANKFLPSQTSTGISPAKRIITLCDYANKLSQVDVSEMFSGNYVDTLGLDFALSITSISQTKRSIEIFLLLVNLKCVFEYGPPLIPKPFNVFQKIKRSLVWWSNADDNTTGCIDECVLNMTEKIRQSGGIGISERIPLISNSNRSCMVCRSADNNSEYYALVDSKWLVFAQADSYNSSPSSSGIIKSIAPIHQVELTVISSFQINVSVRSKTIIGAFKSITSEVHDHGHSRSPSANSRSPSQSGNNSSSPSMSGSQIYHLSLMFQSESGLKRFQTEVETRRGVARRKLRKQFQLFIESQYRNVLGAVSVDSESRIRDGDEDTIKKALLCDYSVAQTVSSVWV